MISRNKIENNSSVEHRGMLYIAVFCMGNSVLCTI